MKRFKRLKYLVFGLVFIPMVFVASALGGPFYAMCLFAGEKDTLDPMMDRVAQWLVDKAKQFAEG